jgi:hypothetical protein
VIPVARAFYISARIVNVETASVESTADATCENTTNIGAIVTAANELACRLLNPEGCATLTVSKPVEKPTEKPIEKIVENENYKQTSL